MENLAIELLQAKAVAWDLREEADRLVAEANEKVQMVHAQRAEIQRITQAIEAEKQGGEKNIAK